MSPSSVFWVWTFHVSVHAKHLNGLSRTAPGGGFFSDGNASFGFSGDLVFGWVNGFSLKGGGAASSCDGGGSAVCVFWDEWVLRY